MEPYKLFSQILGGVLFITGMVGVARTWPPGDLYAWLFTLLGLAALWAGKSPKK